MMIFFLLFVFLGGESPWGVDMVCNNFRGCLMMLLQLLLLLLLLLAQGVARLRGVAAVVHIHDDHIIHDDQIM